MHLPFLNGIYPSLNASSLLRCKISLPECLIYPNQHFPSPNASLVWAKRIPSLNAIINMFEWTKKLAPWMPQKVYLNEPNISPPECLKNRKNVAISVNWNFYLRDSKIISQKIPQCSNLFCLFENGILHLMWPFLSKNFHKILYIKFSLTWRFFFFQLHFF